MHLTTPAGLPSAATRLTRFARSLVLLTLALALLATLFAAPASAASKKVFRIAPNGTTGGSGSTWSTAGSLADLPRFVAQARPGDEVWIRGDAGPYHIKGAVSIASGGSASKPVIVRGVAANGSERARPKIVGTRTAPYRPNGNPGTEVFKLLQGADHLKFRNMAFVNQGKGVFRIAGNIHNLTIANMRATNVRRFLESYPSGDAKTATATRLRINNVRVNGFSKGVIRLQDNTNDVVIRNVVGDSKRQDKDRFAIGVHLDDTVHNVLLKRVTMRNAHDTASGSYWNGDGFAAEDNTYDLRFVDTKATGNTDAGYDLKSRRTKLVRAFAKGNKRNYRFWGQAELIKSVGRNPRRRGGTGSQAQIWAGNNARVRVVGGTFADKHRKTYVFAVEDKARVTLKGVKVRKAGAAKRAVVERGARLVGR